VHLKLARDTLLDPAIRFAYDRFGPDVTNWQHCVTIRDFLVQGVQATLPYYIGSGIVMVVFGWLGFLDWGRYVSPFLPSPAYPRHPRLVPRKPPKLSNTTPIKHAVALPHLPRPPGIRSPHRHPPRLHLPRAAPHTSEPLPHLPPTIFTSLPPNPNNTPTDALPPLPNPPRRPQGSRHILHRPLAARSATATAVVVASFSRTRRRR